MPLGKTGPQTLESQHLVNGKRNQIDSIDCNDFSKIIEEEISDSNFENIRVSTTDNCLKVEKHCNGISWSRENFETDRKGTVSDHNYETHGISKEITKFEQDSLEEHRGNIAPNESLDNTTPKKPSLDSLTGIVDILPRILEHLPIESINILQFTSKTFCEIIDENKAKLWVKNRSVVNEGSLGNVFGIIWIFENQRG